MPRQKMFYQQIEGLRKRYYLALPGKESLVNMLNETEVSEQVYNSNAIENSTLTLEETEKILLQIDLERFINEREIFEAKNLARVMEYISMRAKDQDLDKEMILLLHKMLITNIRNDIAGRFRANNEWVRVGSYIAPNPNDVERLIDQMLAMYHGNANQHIVTRIASLHLTFEHIHPFVDGNGRIGRVMNNYALMREGYVPMTVRYTDRETYYQAFKNFEGKGDTSVMEDIVGKALVESYHKRLAYLEDKKTIPLAQYAKQERISLSNLLNKARRQTIEAFREKDVWKIGISSPLLFIKEN
ncbi:Fic family protein [Candidatus Uhrbacteria bacterium]|nr:Fic family protein [Candidatus Uhrbacteria bacterium]